MHKNVNKHAFPLVKGNSYQNLKKTKIKQVFFLTQYV